MRNKKKKTYQFVQEKVFNSVTSISSIRKWKPNINDILPFLPNTNLLIAHCLTTTSMSFNILSANNSCRLVFNFIVVMVVVLNVSIIIYKDLKHEIQCQTRKDNSTTRGQVLGPSTELKIYYKVRFSPFWQIHNGSGREGSHTYRKTKI